jgi:hypothetical protein
VTASLRGASEANFGCAAEHLALWPPPAIGGILLGVLCWSLCPCQRLAAQTATAPIAIEARDFALTMPARLPAGLTTFIVENRGEHPHSIRFLRLTGGKTFDDFTAWQKTGGAPPAWLEPAGGIAPIVPKSSEQYTATLTPGRYVVLCTYPADDGQTHVDKGMVARLDVDGAVTSTTKAPADADITLRMRDHGFQLTAPVSGGHPLWHLQNIGTEPHQAVLIRLPEGVSEYTERTWLSSGGRGVRGGIPSGGVVELPADADAWFQIDLSPGRYLLLCSELEEEGRHFDLGMIYRFQIE